MARRLAAVALALTVSTLAHAQAGIPSPPQTVRPAAYNLVCTDNDGVPDPAGAFTIILRDALGNPIANRAVRIVFSGCAGDVALSSNQPTATSVDCANRVVTFTTDGDGVISGSILGHVQDFATPTLTACALIQAKNLAGESPAWVDLGTVPVAIYDLDGVNGVDAHDYLNFLCDKLSNQSRKRSDYDHNGLINGADLLPLLSRIDNELSELTPARCDAQATVIPPVAASLSGFNIRWGSCPSPYAQTRVFTCADEDSDEVLTVTVIAPAGLASIAAAEIDLEIVAPGRDSIPDWWRFDDAGCRYGSLSAASVLTPPAGCPPRVGVGGGSQMLVTWPYIYGNHERVHIFTPYSNPVTLSAGNEYALTKIVFDHAGTLGNVCDGCIGDVTIQVNRIRLIPSGCGTVPPAPTVVVESPDYAGTAFWQGIPIPVLAVFSGYPSQLVGGDAGRINDLVVHGSNFMPGCTVVLRHSGATDIPGTVQSVAADGASLTAQFDLAGAALGNWDIVVTNPDAATASSQTPIVVMVPVSAQLVAAISGTAGTRPNHRITETLSIHNLGTVPFEGTAFAAFYVKAGTGPVSVFDNGHAIGTYTPVPQGARDLVGVFTAQPVSWLPGSLYDLRFTAPGAAGTTQVEAELFQVPPTLAGPPAELQARGATTAELIHASAVAQGYTWPALTPGFAAALKARLDLAVRDRTQSLAASQAPDLSMSDYPELLKAAVQDALTALAGTYPADVTAFRSVWDPLRTTPAQWTTFQSQLPARAAAMASPPAPAHFYPSPAVVRQIIINNSWDPNDKSGPAGPGTGHFVAERAPLDYVIHFENLPAATAAAQTVAVDDQLDASKVDLGTLSLGRITFGDRVIDPPPGLTSYTTDVDLRPEMDLIARVTAVLGSTGNLSWRFKSLDPATLAPTDDAFLGFLPPNTSPPNGEGSVSVVVTPLASVGDGTSFANWARIVFDENPYIDTPVWSNTLDLSPPSSQVTSLGPIQNSTSFGVTWAGTDGGSGVSDYSVFVSDDGGPYTLWQSHSTSTNATFSGQDGHVYAFYSTACDQVGQVEPAPVTPDATTQIVTGIEDTRLPVRFGMILAGSNPVRSNATVELALPRAGRARIEVIDIAGRLVFSREFKELRAGYHPVTLNEFDRVFPGVFMVRATSGGESARIKIAVVR
jgi:hypothetical protein